MNFDKKISKSLLCKNIKKEAVLSLNSTDLLYIDMIKILSLTTYLFLTNDYILFFTSK